jgi:hypothetical protein
MKFTTIAVASFIATSSTLALAQAGGANAGADVSGRAGVTTQNRPGAKEPGTTGRAQGSSTGSAVTTGSDVPQDKPNLSSSPESSDTSQRVK